MSKIVLIDAYSQIYRLFFAMRMLNDSQGRPVNALFGMMRLLMQLEDKAPSDFGALVFDKGKPTRRVELCPEYKAQRPPMPDDLRRQVEHIKELAKAFGWSILMQEGLEADDIIAAVARRRGDAEVAIITHDKDIAQLTADAGIMLMTPESGNTWQCTGREGARAKFGVEPELLGDYLALVGDTADNIMGVAGIGPKTAASLLNQHGPLAAILENPDVIENKRIAAKIQENKELLQRNMKLVALDDVLPDGCVLPEGIRRGKPDWDKILQLAKDSNFKSLFAEIEKRGGSFQQEMFL